VVITDDLAAAGAALAAGRSVVLIVAADGPVADPGPGRMAVMVGDAADPAVRAAAEEMERELFIGRAPD
jgi:hypothetical protein